MLRRIPTREPTLASRRSSTRYIRRGAASFNRHDAATALITAGATLHDVQTLLRHKSPAMAQRYGHMVRERRARTAGLLDAQVPEGEREPKAHGDRSPSKG